MKCMRVIFFISNLSPCVPTKDCQLFQRQTASASHLYILYINLCFWVYDHDKLYFFKTTYAKIQRWSELGSKTTFICDCYIIWIRFLFFSEERVRLKPSNISVPIYSLSSVKHNINVVKNFCSWSKNHTKYKSVFVSHTLICVRNKHEFKVALCRKTLVGADLWAFCHLWSSTASVLHRFGKK